MAKGSSSDFGKNIAKWITTESAKRKLTEYRDTKAKEQPLNKALKWEQFRKTGK